MTFYVMSPSFDVLSVIINFFISNKPSQKHFEKNNSVSSCYQSNTIELTVTGFYHLFTFPFSHELHLSRRLGCIKSSIGNVLNLTFIHTIPGATTGHPPQDIRQHDQVCAREVILAVPLSTLQNLDWKPFEDSLVNENLKSVVENPVIIAYFTYNQIWWRGTDPYDEVITDLPIRKVKYMGSHYNSNETAEYVFMVTSADSKDVEYFRGLLDQTYYDGSKKHSCSKTTYFIAQVHSQIAEMYGVCDKDIPEPQQVIVQRWEGQPYGGWTVWHRGVNWANIQQRMIKPSKDHKVYVVGNAFMGGADQFSIEGAMQSVEDMLSYRYSQL